jgi:uracil-DNA glycosylase
MYNLVNLINKLETDWKNILILLLENKSNIEDFLNQQQNLFSPDIEIFPPKELIFNAFNYFNFKDLNIVILGQDVYPNKRNGIPEAHGLCFSVVKEVKIPPSLKNIFKELSDDLKCDLSTHGNLENWAKQGILLLNSALTVIEKKPTSHSKIWKDYTDSIIDYISKNSNDIVFILLGNFAKNKIKLIDTQKHHIISANHPSPLSANRGGFFGSKIFSKTNQIMNKLEKKNIDWKII